MPKRDELRSIRPSFPNRLRWPSRAYRDSLPVGMSCGALLLCMERGGARYRDTAVGMSEGNVEIMRVAMEAFNRRDRDAFSARFAPDAEIVPVRAALEGTIYRGPRAGAEYCDAVDAAWAGLRWVVEDFQLVEDRVLAVGRIEGRG